MRIAAPAKNLLTGGTFSDPFLAKVLLKERLAELESRQNWTSKKYSVAGVEVEENVEDNRLRIYFPTKPSTEIRNQLKHNGFKWSPNNMAWQRFLNQDSIATAKYLLEKIKNMA